MFVSATPAQALRTATPRPRPESREVPREASTHLAIPSIISEPRRSGTAALGALAPAPWAGFTIEEALAWTSAFVEDAPGALSDPAATAESSCSEEEWEDTVEALDALELGRPAPVRRWADAARAWQLAGFAALDYVLLRQSLEGEWSDWDYPAHPAHCGYLDPSEWRGWVQEAGVVPGSLREATARRLDTLADERYGTASPCTS